MSHCRWWQAHKWSQWSEIARGALVERQISDPKGEERSVGTVLHQERVCERCNLKQIRVDKSRL